jgi:guanylate kinase
VYGNYYATPKHPALDQLAKGTDVLLEIDVQGALQVRHHYPDALMIFILPPDEPTLLQRLRDRGRDSADDIHKRFTAAKREIHMAKGSRAFDTMVVNDSLDRAVEEIAKIIKHKRAGGI